MTDQCLFCDEPATILCDAMIARAIGDYAKYPGSPAYPVVTMEQTLLARCDAPCCAAHARGVGHICGGEEGCESIDHCVKHASEKEPAPLIEASRVPELRRKLHRGWRMERIGIVPEATP